MNSCVTLMDLPDDIILEIFFYVKNIREKIRLKRVCMRFSQLVSIACKIQGYSLINRDNLLYDQEDQSILLGFQYRKLMSIAPKLERLCITRACTHFRSIIAPSNLYALSHIISLDIDVTLLIERNVVDCIISKIDCLKELKLRFYDGEINLLPSSLESLHIYSTLTPVRSLKEYIIRKGKKLKRLTFAVRDQLIALDTELPLLNIVASSSPRLEYFRIDNVRLQPKTCDKIFEQLRILILNGFIVDIKLWESIVSKCPNLKRCAALCEEGLDEELKRIIQQYFTILETFSCLDYGFRLCRCNPTNYFCVKCFKFRLDIVLN